MPHFFEIIFFALLTCYLVFRLWSVLGDNTPADEERQNHKKQSEDSPPVSESFLSFPVRPEPEEDPSDLPPGIKEGIRRIHQVDPDFDFEDFMAGAQAAYEFILKQFATGDKDALKPLVTADVYGVFETAIEGRAASGHHMDIDISKIERMDIEEAGVDIKTGDSVARITVRYRAYQIVCTYDQDGICLDNPAKISKPVTDIWTFERSPSSDSPNWLLSATRTESF